MTWYEFLLGIIVAVLTSNGLWTCIQSRKCKSNDTDKLLTGLAYHCIIDLCSMYINRGWVSPEEYNELYHYLYSPYAARGGNGTAKRMVGLVSELPSVPPADD